MSNLATITNNILADSGIDDINVVVSTGSYANPAWITALAWTKITGAPTIVGSVTASSPLFSSGGTSPNITIQQASDSQSGFLSSTDWTTFNNKQNALTNPVTGTGASGQVAYFNGTTTITSESNLFWDATNDRLGIGTSSPTDRLTLHRDGATGVYAHWRNNSNANNAYIGITGSGLMQIQNNGNIDFYTGASYNNQMTLAGTGNLIIGNPGTDNGARLQVSGTATVSGNGLFGGATALTGLNGGISVNGASNSGINFRTSDVLRGYVYTTSGNMWVETVSGSVILAPNGSPALTLASTGASTFSSSVTAASGNILDGTPQLDFTLNVNTAFKHSIVASNFASSPVSSNTLDFRVANGANSQVVAMTLNGSGNVGIGTSSPTQKLTIAGTTDAYMNFAPSSFRNFIVGSDVLGYIIYDNNAASYRLTISPSGNLLVGTTTDNGARLQVSGGATFSGFVEASTSSSSIYDFGIRNTGTGNTRLRIGNATSSARLTITLGAAASEFARIGPEGPFPLHLQTNGADRLSIDGSTGAATFSSSVSTGTLSLSGSTFQSSADFYIGTNNANLIQFYTSNQNRLIITPSGNVGIGTSSPVYTLDVRGRIWAGTSLLIGESGGGYSIIESTSGNGIWLRPNGVSFPSGMFLTTGGNLGLGVTPSPGGLSGYVLFELGNGGASIYSGPNQNLSGANISWSGGTASYKISNFATLYNQQSGQHQWYNAPSGTAGNAISFTQAMTLFATGNLLVGSPSPISDNGARLQVSGTARFTSTSGYGIRNSYTSENLELFFGTLIGGRIGIQSKVISSGGVYPLFLSPEGGGIDVTGAATFNNLAGSGNRIVVANSGGTLISAVIGSGLAFDGTTLTATGGGSGSISGGGTSGFMPVFTGATSIGNSIVQANASRITVVSNTDGQIIEMARSGGAYYWKLGIDGSSRYVLYNNSNTSMFEMDPNNANTTFGSGQNVTLRLGRNAGDFGEVIYSGGSVTLSNGWASTSGFVQQTVNGQWTRLFGSGILDHNRTSEGTFYRLLVNGNGRMILATDVSSNAIIRTGNNVDLRLGVNEDALTIKNGGNVLIGTTTDTGSRLGIKSSGTNSFPLIVQRSANTNTLAAISETSGGDGTFLLANSLGSTNIQLLSNGTSILNGGNVLIGTTSDVGATLHVGGTIRTGQLPGAIQNAVNWRLGTARGGPVTSNATVRVEIDGVLVDLLARYV